jgi:hypothetical protein
MRSICANIDPRAYLLPDPILRLPDGTLAERADPGSSLSGLTAVL